MTVDTSWDLIDDRQTITVDGLIADTVPTVVVGETVTFEFFTEGTSQNIDDLDKFREYVEFVNSASTDYGTTFEGIPWYRFSTYPNTNISSLLFDVEPTDRIPDLFPFWGLLVSVNETSALTKRGGRFEVTFFVIAERENYTRSEIIDEFRGEL